MTSQDALPNTRLGLRPLQRQLTLGRRLVDVIMLVIELFDLRLLQLVDADVRVQVRLDVLSQRESPCLLKARVGPIVS